MFYLYNAFRLRFSIFRLLSIAIISLWSATNICAKQKNERPELSAKNIPATLKNDFTNAILRHDSTYLKVVGLDEVQYYRTYTVTIMNEKGDSYGNIIRPYSDLNNINDISGAYYDASGKIIQQIKKKDIMDRSTFGSDFIFNTDSRLKIYKYVPVTYPYTLSVTIKETIKNTLFLPDWQPQHNHDLSVIHSIFLLEYPNNIPIRTKAYQMPSDIQTTKANDDNKTICTWILKNQSGFEEQPYSETGNYQTATLVIAAQHFDLMGHQGKLDTWKDFGLFNFDLNKNRDDLSQEMIQKVKALVQSDTSIVQKIQTLYRYMQQNTRYIADVAGLSGWQTFPATEVCQKGYGDCKGLTNYLKALLKAADIPAYMALISAGRDNYIKVDPSFPNNYFNHVILCVPNGNDSVWVECTSPVFKAGYLGDFTDNRYALVCGPDGGKLVKTPLYNQHKNYIRRNATFQLKPDADEQVIHLDNYYCGPMQDNLFMLLKMTSKDKIQNTVQSKFQFPTYKVNQFQYNFTGTQMLPAIQEHVEVSANGVVNHTGKRYFVQISWIPNPMAKITQTTNRTKPLALNKSFTISDSVVFSIPTDIDIEYLPEDIRISYPFATLECSFKYHENNVVFIQKYTQKKGVYSIDDFNNYQNLYHKINQQNRAGSIVLIPKPEIDLVTDKQ